MISFKETDLHSHIKELLWNMDLNVSLKSPHGSDEHGNDLVVVKRDVFREAVIGVIVEAGNKFEAIAAGERLAKQQAKKGGDRRDEIQNCSSDAVTGRNRAICWLCRSAKGRGASYQRAVASEDFSLCR